MERSVKARPWWEQSMGPGQERQQRLRKGMGDLLCLCKRSCEITSEKLMNAVITVIYVIDSSHLNVCVCVFSFSFALDI